MTKNHFQNFVGLDFHVAENFCQIKIFPALLEKLLRLFNKSKYILNAIFIFLKNTLAPVCDVSY